ncbi:MAG: EAL domain-containing protein [Terriglobia bacterium]|nr:EAL domain-containing protein [Terriglobia bacterium]
MDIRGLNLALSSVLLLIFAWILHKQRRGQTQFWFAGWLALVGATALSFVSAVSPDIASTVLVCATELAGALFIASVSTLCDHPVRRWLLAFAIAVPSIAFTIAGQTTIRYSISALAIGSIALAGIAALELSHHGKTAVYPWTALVVAGLICSATAVAAVGHGFDYSLRILVSSLFLVAGCLYIRKFPRFSLGVLIASCGLFSWGAALFLDPSVLPDPTMSESNGLLVIAKYLVAIGMIVTILEEQIEEAGVYSQQLLHQANHDILTSLPNRILLQDRLNQALARCRRSKSMMAVFSIDLDRFKHINDNFGHRVGDLYLKEVAQRLASRVRDGDTIARTGGDEFTAVLENVRSPEDASNVARALLETLQRPLLIEGSNHLASASIGVAVYPFDGGDSDALRRAAEQAMFRAKHSGSGHLETSTEEARETLEIESTLRRALEIGGFHLQFQPQVRRDGSIAALEALLRFRHPKLGMLPPSRFIPIAEESGLIVPIGDWVLQEVCRQGVEWKSRFGTGVKIAVNVSPLQFSRADFAMNVASIFRKSGYDPSLIELELTETLVMRDVQESSRQLSQLKRLGFHIAVDDFGTGYSSLSYLHQLPIDTLKIDKSFIDKVTEPSGTRPIVEAVLSLSKSLSLTTIAEGVETSEQCAILNHLGCDIIQGFYFFKPLPVDSVEQLLLTKVPYSQTQSFAPVPAGD